MGVIKVQMKLLCITIHLQIEIGSGDEKDFKKRKERVVDGMLAVLNRK